MLPEALFSLLLYLSEVRDSESLRFAYSAAQGYDSSCGLSTLAGFMSRYWNEPETELGLANEFLIDKVILGDFTVFLADLKRILIAKGFDAAVYKMNLDQMTKAAAAYAPVIVHYASPEGHFALVLAIRDDFVITADPSTGTTAIGIQDFLARWSGYIILATKPGQNDNADALEGAIASVTGRLELLDRVTFSASRGNR